MKEIRKEVYKLTNSDYIITNRIFTLRLNNKKIK